MQVNKEYLKWLLWRRKKLSFQIEGFHAHWDTNVCLNTKFEEYSHVLKGANIHSSTIGRFSKIYGSILSNTEVGCFSSIAARSKIGGGGDHPLDQISHHSIFYMSNRKQHPSLILSKTDKYPNALRRVKIGNDVWIGSDVIVKHGVHICDGAVVASGSVVVKNVPPYAIVGGVPAKLIRYRHNEELRNALMKSKWWDWPIAALQVISDEFDKDKPLTIERFSDIENKVQKYL